MGWTSLASQVDAHYKLHDLCSSNLVTLVTFHPHDREIEINEARE